MIQPAEDIEIKRSARRRMAAPQQAQGGFS